MLISLSSTLIKDCNTRSPTFIKIVKKKSVGDYSGIPYVCTLLNCLLWVVYGLPIVEFQVLVVTINAAGCVIELIYLALYLINAQKSIRVYDDNPQLKISSKLNFIKFFARYVNEIFTEDHHSCLRHVAHLLL